MYSKAHLSSSEGTITKGENISLEPVLVYGQSPQLKTSVNYNVLEILIRIGKYLSLFAGYKPNDPNFVIRLWIRHTN
jgi:hypothetical protein